MPFLVRWLDAVYERFGKTDAAHWNGLIVFYQLLLIGCTIDLTRPMQSFDYIRF
ncbi:hypothetical protein HY251_08280 [bacterium]|nr:hypothetical protein [bacterium]